MSDAGRDLAVRVTAIWQLHELVDEFEPTGWGDGLPEIGQDSYESVIRLMREMLPPRPDLGGYLASYAHLEILAQIWAEKHGEVFP